MECLYSIYLFIKYCCNESGVQAGVLEKTIIWHEWVVEEKYLKWLLQLSSLTPPPNLHSAYEWIYLNEWWEAEGRINKRIKSSQWKWKLCLSACQCSHTKGLRLPVENLIRARAIFAWHPTAANIIISS